MEKIFSLFLEIDDISYSFFPSHLFQEKGGSPYKQVLLSIINIFSPDVLYDYPRGSSVCTSVLEETNLT